MASEQLRSLSVETLTLQQIEAKWKEAHIQEVLDLMEKWGISIEELETEESII